MHTYKGSGAFLFNKTDQPAPGVGAGLILTAAGGRKETDAGGPSE
jgi:hypothetical protein